MRLRRERTESRDATACCRRQLACGTIQCLMRPPSHVRAVAGSRLLRRALLGQYLMKYRIVMKNVTIAFEGRGTTVWCVEVRRGVPWCGAPIVERTEVPGARAAGVACRTPLLTSRHLGVCAPFLDARG